MLKQIKKFIRSKPGLYNMIAPVYWRLRGWNTDLYAHKALSRFSKHDWNEIKNLTQETKGIYLLEPTISWTGNLLQRPQHMAMAMGKIGFLSLYLDFGVPSKVFYEVGMNTYLTGPDNNLYTLPNIIRIIYSTCYPYKPETVLATSNASQTTIYEFVDDLHSEISGHRTDELIQLYNYMVKSRHSDFVIVTAKNLMDKAINDGFPEEKVLYLPNGVDVNHFQNPSEVSFNKDLTDFLNKYPIIVGYHGAIAPWLWFEVIQDLINIMKDIGFLFIGPLYGINKFPLRGDNVFWTGKVDYEVLPAYVYQYTIGWIPFKPGPIAQTTSPLKLFEYFATGKPAVVSSEMFECTQFPEVFAGDSVKELKESIDQAVEKSTDKNFQNRLKELAQKHTWEKRAITLEKFLTKHLSQF